LPQKQNPGRKWPYLPSEVPISRSVSGFPEWQPKVKIVEEKWIHRISENARLQGFVPVETASVEYLSTLEIKGEIDKEIYTLGKLNSTTTRELALHYDLTIPLARFVTEHFSQLSFPFKRYQIQKVWRGERPQFGRYREFYQADIDIIDSENLPDLYDAEVLVLGIRCMLDLNIPGFKVGVSNRKIYEGYLKGLGLVDTVPVLRIIDKLDKVGLDGVVKMLVESCSLTTEQAQKCVRLAQTPFAGRTSQDLAKELAVDHEQFLKGLSELELLQKNIALIADEKVKASISADLSFVRGFDYYTGSIFEGKFLEADGYGSICSGGRYDNLAEGYGSRKLPGVGFSIGLTRILAKLEERATELVDYPKTSYDFCIIVEGDPSMNQPLFPVAAELKHAGHAVNIISVNKLKKGIQVASRTGAAVAVFLFDGKCMLKQLSTGQQVELVPGQNSVATAKGLL
jgi:histidyl-tRNA synthetase